MKARWIWFVCVTALFSCEEKVERPLPQNAPDLLVVEAVLTNEYKNQLVTLTLPHTTPNGTSLPATGAVVTIAEEKGITYWLSEFPAGSGKYYSPLMRAVFGRTYALTISYQGITYTAQDRSIAVDAMPPLTLAKTTEPYYRITSKAEGNVPNYLTHDVSWVGTPYCSAGQTCQGLLISYDLKNLDANDIFKPAKDDFIFPVGSVIIRRKYSVSPAYQAFLRSMLTETEWRGSVFDVDRSNTATNLSTGAVGFFAVTTVVSDTTVVK